jgi:hypothetical protein
LRKTRVFARRINYFSDTKLPDFVSEVAQNKLLLLGWLKPRLLTEYGMQEGNL